MLESVNDGDNVRILADVSLLFSRNKRPELVDVDDCTPVEIAGQVEMAHTNLTEVTRMVFIEVGTSYTNSNTHKLGYE